MKTKSQFIFTLYTLAGLLIYNSSFAAPAVVKRTSELKEKPFSDAKALSTLAEKTTVDLISLSGGWAKVKVKNQTGFVKIFNLQTAMAVANNMNTDFAKSGSKKAIASTGVKGVSEENLKNLSPAPELAKQLDKFEPTSEQVIKFQTERKLITK